SHFVHPYTRVRKTSNLLMLMYGLGAAAALLSITGQAATGMEVKFYGFAPTLGWALPIVLLAAYPPVMLAIYDLSVAMRRTESSIDRSRFRDLRLGAIITLVGGSTDFLPSLGLNLYPLGIIGNIGFAVVTT